MSAEQERDEARAEYQELWSQYQQELAQIAAWQTRTKARLAKVRELAARWDAASALGMTDPHAPILRALAHQVLEALDGDL